MLMCMLRRWDMFQHLDLMLRERLQVSPACVSISAKFTSDGLACNNIEAKYVSY